ncbi:MAG: major capsid protein [Ectothiorhodospiraceae bacterium]|nr:major capsid protein [Ectothiorhodospiraceae bacterium]MCH8502914.1 major capsid protein [Ectothiorhodospiraceae bacterium]
MADVFSTNFMMAALESLQRPSTFLLARFFADVQTETSEEIHFDVIDKTRRLAPFVSPVVAGRVVEGHGHTTKTFKPAYVKPKTPWDPNRPLKRNAGERIGGQLSPSQRMEQLVVMTMEDHMEMILRRMEVMASEALRTGAIIVTGEDYPTVEVNFGRHQDQTETLTGANQWGENGVSPLANLNTWALRTLRRSGARPIDVTMDTEAWSIFQEDPEVEKRLDTRRVQNNSIITGGPMDIGGTYMGSIDGFNIWTYADWYIDPEDGQEKPIFPDHTVVMTSPLLEGVRAHGAIRDEAAGFQAVEMFPKSWVEQDPAVRYVMTQSAPLVVPRRINHSFSATVRSA